MKLRIVSFLLIFVFEMSAQLPFHLPPKWSETAIWYQIFPERFRNGDDTNNPQPKWMQNTYPFSYEKDWKLSSWTSDWYENADDKKKFYEQTSSRRYGGDLQGVLNKLDYIQGLGINAIYFNPLNDAPSHHKYDARNHHHIDITFGTDPEGDFKIIQNETYDNPNTWKWTSADLLFLKVIEECHKRGIKVILDFSWNHTGADCVIWKDVKENQLNSKYKDWYDIQSFTNPSEGTEFKYRGWSGVPELPEFKKIDVVGRRLDIAGTAYHGNMQQDAKNYVFAASKRWLKPIVNGKETKGVDGFRLDVADQIGLEFWKDYRKFVRSVKDDCYLVGEIWWEVWPNSFINPRVYLQGDMFDAVMHYHQYKPARSFFAKTTEYGGAEKLKQEFEEIFKNFPNEESKRAQMSMSTSHDTPRLLSCFYNKGVYKYKQKPNDDVSTLTGKPDEETYQRVKNFLAFQFTMLGSPQIYAGDEMGMWGTDDPDNRKPLWWNDMKFEPETNNPFVPNSKKEKVKIGFNKNLNDYYKKLIEIRNSNEVLSKGDFKFIFAEKDVVIFERNYNNKKITVLINNQNKPFPLKSNLNFSGIDVLSKQKVKQIKTLKPWQVLIIK